MPARPRYRQVKWYVYEKSTRQWECLEGIHASLDFLDQGLLRDNHTASDVLAVLVANYNFFVDRGDVGNLASAKLTFMAGKQLDDRDTTRDSELDFNKIEDGEEIGIIVSFPILSKVINIQFWRSVPGYAHFFHDDLDNLSDAPLSTVPHSRYSDGSEDGSSNDGDSFMYDIPTNRTVLIKHITWEFEYYRNVVQHAKQMERLVEVLEQICPNFKTQCIYLWETDALGTKGDFIGNMVQEDQAAFEKIQEGGMYLMLESTEQLIQEVERTEMSDTTIMLKDVGNKHPIWGVNRQGLRPPLSLDALTVLVKGKKSRPVLDEDKENAGLRLRDGRPS